MKKRVALLLAILLILISTVGMAENYSIMVRGDVPVTDSEAATDTAPAYAAYNGKRLGVLTGPLMEDAAAEFFPDSETLIFNSYPDCIAALLAGKIDAYLGDEPSMKMLHTERQDIDYIPERITENNYSFAFQKNDEKSAALCAELNGFLARCWADGTMDELDGIWFGTDEDRKVVDMSGLTGENGTIKVATTATDAPFSYIKDGKNVGYDIDLVVRFCRDRGYALELGDVDFASRIPAVQSGKYDFSTDMNVTPEREEQVLFSDPTSKGGIVLAVRASDLADLGSENDGSGHLCPQDLAGKRIAVQTGTISGEVAQAVIGDVQLDYYNSQIDVMTALRSNKADAWATDEPVARYLLIENTDLKMVEEKLDNSSLAAVFAKTDAGQALCDQYSAFVDSLWADGTMAQIDAIWFGTDGDKRTVLDYEALPDTNGTLRMAVDTSLIPFAMVKDGRIVGYDVDIAARFCEANGYRLEVVSMSFDGILPSVQTGKCDFAACCITVTEERAQSVLFSSENYKSGTVLVVRKGEAPTATESGAAYTSLDQLNGKRIGVQTGTSFDAMVSENLPDAQVEYYNTKADLVAALTGHKIDAFAVDEPVAQILMRENDRITYMPEYLDNYVFALVFQKGETGEALRDQFNSFLLQLPEGTLDALATKWFGEDEDTKTMPDISSLPAGNGTLRLATESGYAPFEYVRNGEVVGYDMELAALFCEACGYGLEIVDMNFDGILPSVQTGKCDFAAAGISITPERAESVLFSESNYTGGTVLAVLRAKEPVAGEAPEEAEDISFLGGIQSSFNKTFIREGRWKLFAQGVLTTLLITGLTILFGTALGFLVFMMCRNGNPAANLITRFCMWLVQGMPMVVLLMILYYIIFGSVEISGVLVAVIGFTLTFGAGVFGLLKMGVGAVDGGQYEAAYALGYSNRRTFFKIILPQALPHVLPAYRGEIVGLIKATAIVGYIAVQDLTKMGDIVRSRTYEAFFPLIAVTVIYFVLEGLIGFLVSRIGVNFNPKRRKPADILKGVKTDD